MDSLLNSVRLTRTSCKTLFPIAPDLYFSAFSRHNGGFETCSRTIAWFLFTATILSVGCSAKPAATSDSDLKPIALKLASISEGVTKLQELNGTIKAAFDAGTPHECDGALHEAVEIVNALSTTARDEGLSADGLETVNTNAKMLFDSFMQIHEGFHSHGDDHSHESEGTEKNAYEQVADSITEALTALGSAK